MRRGNSVFLSLFDRYSEARHRATLFPSSFVLSPTHTCNSYALQYFTMKHQEQQKRKTRLKLGRLWACPRPSLTTLQTPITTASLIGRRFCQHPCAWDWTIHIATRETNTLRWILPVLSVSSLYVDNSSGPSLCGQRSCGSNFSSSQRLDYRGSAPQCILSVWAWRRRRPQRRCWTKRKGWTKRHLTFRPID